MQIRRVPWSEIEKLVKSLAKQINKKYDVIIGINRGGLIPSVMLSHLTKIRHGVTTIESYQGKKKSRQHKTSLHISMIGELGPTSRVLLVDDIADSGESLIEVIKVLHKLGCTEGNVDTATLHYKAQSKFKPTFYGKEVPNYDWLNYPWEKL
jgi:hypoxanthine phosphoribosyltransferase